MFRNPIDICNRALQHCGATRIDETLGFSEDSKAAYECSFVYDKLRQAELRRNTWKFAIRTCVLRPIDDTFMLLSPTLWSSVTTYFVGALVSDALGGVWKSKINGNVGNALGYTPAAWEPYFGSRAVPAFDPSMTYFAGEPVYVAAGDGTYSVYMSLLNSNDAVPGTVDTYDATVTYRVGDLVTVSSTVYQSLVDLNLGQAPASHPTQWTVTTTRAQSANAWQKLDAALSPLMITYPIGAGPAWQASTRNAFMLPAGFLRKAPRDPKAGGVSYLGAPSGLGYDDWRFQDQYIISTESAPIVFRFVADVTDVSAFDPMFAEGLGSRIGLEIVGTLTQSTAKKQDIGSIYAKFMSEARLCNAIEIGAEEPAEDDWIECRM